MSSDGLVLIHGVPPWRRRSATPGAASAGSTSPTTPSAGGRRPWRPARSRTSACCRRTSTAGSAPTPCTRGHWPRLEPLPEPSLAELADGVAGRPLLILDQVTDPHNVGAILRSAAVFGAAGLVMTRRHSPPLDGALAKSASGALAACAGGAGAEPGPRHRRVVKELGFAVIGLDGEAPERLEETAWPERVALVLGAEGKGLRQLTRESCDRIARIATDGPFRQPQRLQRAAIALHWAAAARIGLLGRR